MGVLNLTRGIREDEGESETSNSGGDGRDCLQQCRRPSSSRMPRALSELNLIDVFDCATQPQPSESTPFLLSSYAACLAATMSKCSRVPGNAHCLRSPWACTRLLDVRGDILALIGTPPLWNDVSLHRHVTTLCSGATTSQGLPPPRRAHLWSDVDLPDGRGSLGVTDFHIQL